MSNNNTHESRAILRRRVFSSRQESDHGRFSLTGKTRCQNMIVAITLLGLLFYLGTPLYTVTASPGVHVSVPQSPLSPNQPVYIEFYTDFGEDGTIQLDITKPPLLAIFWQSGPIAISGGLLYNVTAPGFSDPGTYTVSASVNLSKGGTIYASTTFDVLGGAPPGQPGPGFDFQLEVSPPESEVERGDTAHFQINVVYSDPSYSGTLIHLDVTGLGPGMEWHSTPGGQLSITTTHETPPGDYHIEVVGEAQGVVRQAMIVLFVREEPQEEPPPEEPTPEEPQPEEPPPEEPPPEEPQEEPPPEEPPPEEHPPEAQPEEYPQQQTFQPSSAQYSSSFLSNPLYLVLIGLVVIVVLLALILVMRRPRTPPPPRQASQNYCPKCGAPLKADDSFCSSCGARVRE
ncbi:MAG: zinc ribbon domain-containing protein [Theionarchaea archaeon]|nr:zinc ribbon domain-containing protein [Theionarchaea archaeon]